MKFKVLSHTDCDGKSVNVVSGVCNLNADIENINTKNVNEIIRSYILNHKNIAYDFTIIVDLPISEETAQFIELNGSGRFIMLDHHEQSISLNKYSWAHNATDIDGKSTCGAELFYNYITMNFGVKKSLILERYLEGVRLYDTGDWMTASHKILKEYMPEEINSLLSLYRKNFDAVMIDNLHRNKVLSYEHKILAFQIIDKHKSYAKNKCNEVLIRELDGYKVGVVFIGQVSEIDRVHMTLRKAHPELDFFIMVIMRSTISLRTTKTDVNLNEFAQKYSGGGHPKAAGIPYSDEFVTDLLS